jgi:AraC family transcriptional regulator of adaptative response / DNA-3-methyladenine glycosylase II
MVLDPGGCYRALRSRDTRFDGVFYVGVTTTGIYCRPVCTARAPRRDRCRFFDTAAAAERDGFRPCLRCRPELAPGNARVDAVSRVAAQALARIESGALNGRSVDRLAAEFGITARHLRRIVESEYGVTPVQLAQTQRLLLAKHLLTATALPVTEVAFASGFASLRRFNALFQDRYRLSPARLRGPRIPAPSDTFTCEIGYRPPLDWDWMLGFLAARACPGVEWIDGRRYLRTAAIGKHRGWLAAEPAPKGNALRVEIASSLAPSLVALLARLRRLFDLSAHPRQIEHHLSRDPLLRPVVAANPGLRVPGAFDGFEAAVRAVLGQQVSVKAATTLAGRYAAAFGQPLATPYAALHRLTPSASAVAAAAVSDLRAIGLVSARAGTIRGLARLVAGGSLRLEPGAAAAQAVARLQEIRGIGEWTAHYIAMRALGWPDAFPHGDLGVRKALGGGPPRRILAAAGAWSPWRAYAVMALWKSLERKGKSS